MSAARRGALVVALLLAGGVISGCIFESSDTEPATRSPSALKSYRWTTELSADSSLFDQSNAPPALRGAPFVLKASVVGERVAPDRERARAVVIPGSIEPRETVTIGSQRWSRVDEGPWRLGGETFPAARAYLGGTVDLSACVFIEPEESSVIARLRDDLATMPYREEVVPTGPALRYTLRPDQVAQVVGDTALNPFPVLRTLPIVRIDLWVDEARQMLVGFRVGADSATQANVFTIELRLTEIEPAGLTIGPPR